MRDDWNILSSMTGAYQRLDIGTWALAEVIATARDRLNKGKTAEHQKRTSEHDSDYNYKLGRAGILGEIAILVAMKDAGASESLLKYLQAGLLHEDIRLEKHKCSADIVIISGEGRQRHLDVKTSRFMNITGSDGRLRVNRRKHERLMSGGLDAYIGVVAPDYAMLAYLLRPITPQQVESWSLRNPPALRETGNDYYEHDISALVPFPVTSLKNRLHSGRYSKCEVNDLAFNNDEFSATIRAAFPYINWSLV